VSRSQQWSAGKSGSWARCLAAVMLGGGGIAIAASAVPAGSPSAGGSWTRIEHRASFIVEGRSAPATALWLTQHGARGVEPIVGFRAASATLTAAQSKEAVKAGFRLAPNSKVVMTGSFGSDSTSSGRSGTDAFLQVTGAQAAWASGDEGQGVTVAVLDTGIDASDPALSGRVIDGVDLSGSGSPGSGWNHDEYGHGTFVAGLVAGSMPNGDSLYAGEAPEADLVSIKVAGASGVTTEATVVEGIEWAISHEASDNIRILNLSLGVEPSSPTGVNPLDQAVDQAWSDGIVVVTSAGNSGPDNGTIASPGDDPLAITVGAIDDGGADVSSNFSVPSFSSAGPTNYDAWFKPDLAADGVSVVSLRDPGSTIDSENPQARVDGLFFVGSGTSFSAAITSGAAALLLAQDPSLTPDQVKAALLLSASPGPVGDPFVDGHGILNVPAALAVAGQVDLNQSPASLAELSSAALTGSVVQMSSSWAAGTWNPANWSGPAWLASPYASDGSGTPASSPVSGLAWNGAAWNGAAWNGAAWNGAAWNGAAWNGAAWNGAAWNGAAWNGAAWNGAAWNGDQWG
jgi:serine protease AprX